MVQRPSFIFPQDSWEWHDIIGDWTIHIMSALSCKVREMGVPPSLLG